MKLTLLNGKVICIRPGNNITGLQITSYETDSGDWELWQSQPEKFQRWIDEDVHTRLFPGCVCWIGGKSIYHL